MNAERLHDALGLLDDELIEAVGKLRQRKKYTSFRSWAAAVACLCVILVGVSVWQNIDRYDDAPIDEGVDGETQDEENFDGSGTENYHPEDGVVGPTPEGEDEDEHDAVEDESHGSQLASMLVRITKWHDDGFEGVVTEVTGGDFVAVRQKITVIFSREVNIDCGDDEFLYDYDAPNAADCGIKKGEVVKVYYSYRHEDVTAVAYIITQPEE